MSRALLDVNVLLALFDANHVGHVQARTWLDEEIAHGWASCAITQNGFVRVVTQPRYPNSVSPSRAIDLMARATATSRHEFWTCDVSIVDPDIVEGSKVHGTNHVVDIYLLALATARNGRLVTLDRSIPMNAVPGATRANLLVL